MSGLEETTSGLHLRQAASLNICCEPNVILDYYCKIYPIECSGCYGNGKPFNVDSNLLILLSHHVKLVLLAEEHIFVVLKLSIIEWRLKVRDGKTRKVENARFS